MKKLATLFLSIILVSPTFCQTTTKSFLFGGLTRQYIEHVPAIYNGSEAVPLVLCLHGLGDNMSNFSGIGMHQVSDTANFIVLTPQAIVGVIPGQGSASAWNSGAGAYGFVMNSTIDDVGFLNALIDSAIAEYNIDPARIYCTGFSMGGFMSNRLACELNDRITAIASVSGTIGTYVNCNPANPIPVCHFHGTSDTQVNYSGNPFGSDAEPLVEYWRAFNNCDATPVHTAIPDAVADGKTIDHYLYSNGDDDTEVEFYKVTGGTHEWLFQPPYNDLSYTIAIWEFFSKHPQSVLSKKEIVAEQSVDKIYPNPANGILNVEVNELENTMIRILDIRGGVHYEGVAKTKLSAIDISQLAGGVYFLEIIGASDVSSHKVIVY